MATQTNPQVKKILGKLPIQRREQAIQRTDKWDLENRTIVFTASSETPCPEFIYTEDDFGYGSLILDHSNSAIDLKRALNGANLMYSHYGEQIIGVVENAEIVNRELELTTRFAKDAFSDDQFNKVVDGIIRNVSVEAKVNRMKKESYEGEPLVYRATSWEFIAIALTGRPADPTVGIMRSAKDSELYPVIVEGDEETDNISDSIGITSDTIERAEITELTGEKMTGTITVEDLEIARKEERERTIEIREIARHYKQPELGEKFIQDGTDITAVYRAFRENAPKQKPLADVSLGFSKSDQKSYSVVRAINDYMDGKWGKNGFNSFEHECHVEMVKRTNVEAQGIILPFADLTVNEDVANKVARSSPNHVQRATYNTGVATQGGNLVDTVLDASSFYDVLRNKPKIMQMGARSLTQLVGNLSIPRRSGTSTAYWVAEGQDITESNGTFSQLNFTPKTLGALSAITRQMMLQSTPDIEQLVRQDIIIVMALEMDRAAINGSGLNNQPRGILQTAGIGNVDSGADGTTLTYDLVVDLETKVADLNADDEGQAYYFTNAKGVSTLKKLKSTTGYPLWIASEDMGLTPGTPGSINGYPVMRSNQVPKNLTKGNGTGLSAMVYGDFSQVMYAMWGIMDLLPNPFGRGYESGTLLLRAMQTCDIQLRRVESFAAMTALITT